MAENLLDRRTDPEERNEGWVADITYIPTREGLAVPGRRRGPVASRRVVGYSPMADHMESRLVVDALGLAITAAA